MSHRESYWKTTSTAIAAMVAAAAVATWHATSGNATTGYAALWVLLGLLVIAPGLLAAGGLVCLWRDARLDSGRSDPFAGQATACPQAGWLSRIGLRFVLGPALRPGDIVRVRAVDEIRRTLDGDGSCEGLPFMEEMAAFCGCTFRVHRRIDKINDMRHKTGLRRMRGTVTLTAVRCTGDRHGGCEAECQVLWKDQWLTRLSPRTACDAPAMPKPVAKQEPAQGHPDVRYVCQMTRIWEASSAMSRFDIRQDLRPLAWGNVDIGTYVLAMLTRLFNWAQALRGGADFPAMPAGASPAAPASAMSFDAGQAIRVRSREQIAATLTGSRNKGLWFDRDMVRFCGQPAVVRKRIRRLIHESSGRMVVMATPCAVLHDVVATGEFLRLCPQHELILWRDAWLCPRADALGNAQPSPGVQ